MKNSVEYRGAHPTSVLSEEIINRSLIKQSKGKKHFLVKPNEIRSSKISKLPYNMLTNNLDNRKNLSRKSVTEYERHMFTD